MVEFGSVSDLCNHYGCKNIEALSRLVEKATGCGGWVREAPGGVDIGTIVEGSQAEFADYLCFPFTVDEWDAAWAHIDLLADEAWHEANE